jgi:hypothetical protein
VTSIDGEGNVTHSKLVVDEYYKMYEAERALLTFSNYEGDVRDYRLDILDDCVFPLHRLGNLYRVSEEYKHMIESQIHTLPKPIRLPLLREMSLINGCIDAAPSGYHSVFKIIQGLHPFKSYWINTLKDGRYEFCAYVIRRYVRDLIESGLNVTSREIKRGHKITYYVEVVIDNPGEFLRYLLARACSNIEKIHIHRIGELTKITRGMVLRSREEILKYVGFINSLTVHGPTLF